MESRCTPWSASPVRLSGEHRANPVVAANAGDTVAAAWESSDGAGIQVRVRHVDDEHDTWGPTVDLGGRGGRAPSIAVAPDGTVWVVWSEATRDGPNVKVAHSASTGWIVDAGFSTSHDLADDPLIATDGAGHPMIVVRNRQSTDHAAIATRDLDHPGSAAVSLTTDTADVALPRLSIAPDGTAVAVWRLQGTHPQIMAAIRPPAGRWGQATPVASAAAADIAAAAQSGGVATVIWAARDGETSTLVARDFDGTRWGAPATLDRSSTSTGGDRGDRWIDVGFLPDGLAVMWAAPTSAGTALRATTRRRPGIWSTPTLVAGPSPSIRTPSLAVRAGADPTAAWEEIDHNLLRVRIASISAATTCRDISPSDTEAAQVRIAGAGAATAVYTDRRRDQIMAVDLR